MFYIYRLLCWAWERRLWKRRPKQSWPGCNNWNRNHITKLQMMSTPILKRGRRKSRKIYRNSKYDMCDVFMHEMFSQIFLTVVNSDSERMSDILQKCQMKNLWLLNNNKSNPIFNQHAFVKDNSKKTRTYKHTYTHTTLLISCRLATVRICTKHGIVSPWDKHKQMEKWRRRHLWWDKHPSK